MHEVYDITVVSRIIQLATAPVFLLTAIGTLLAVTTNRLGRITDRRRNLESVRVRTRENAIPEDVKTINAELANLSLRAKLMDIAITLCTFSALLVCIVIAIMFLGDILNFNISSPVAVIFITAMLFLVLGLLSFLSEIYVATRTIYYPF